MAPGRRVLSAACGALAAATCLRRSAFVPGPVRERAAPLAAASAAAAFGPPALADPIGEAAKRLAADSYAFAREVDWNSGIYLQAPGKFEPLKALKAIDSMIVMGAQADPKLLKAAADAHHAAIGNARGPNGVTSQADWEKVNAAIGRVVASVPEKTVMDVYKSVSAITDPKVPAYLKSTVNSADADQAYQAFLAFKDVVKRSQVSKAGPAATKPYGAESAAIGKAATKLSDASYPLLKGIDWTSDIYLKPLPGVSARDALKAVDKAIVMGSAADGNALKAAAEAHHKAIGSIDAKGVTKAADFEAVNSALGRVFASVPTSKVMDVYNAFAKIVPGEVPNQLFSTVNPRDANAAAKAFYAFKDVVKTASLKPGCKEFGKTAIEAVSCTW